MGTPSKLYLFYEITRFFCEVLEFPVEIQLQTL